MRTCEICKDKLCQHPLVICDDCFQTQIDDEKDRKEYEAQRKADYENDLAAFNKDPPDHT